MSKTKTEVIVLDESNLLDSFEMAGGPLSL